MAAKGYCTHADVATFLGLTLTAGQQTYATSLLETVEQLVDAETGRGWLMGAQTNETYYWTEWPDSLIYLRYTPINTGVALVITGRTALGEDEETLVADTDYEVMDFAGGVIRLINPSEWNRIQVDYTPVATVPTPVRDATAEWVAALMQPMLRPDTYGVESFSLPDLSIKFAKGGAAAGEIPPGVAAKLAAIDHYPDLPGMA